MNWILLAGIVYATLILGTCVHIIYNTPSATKTLAYMLFAIFIPLIGMGVYYLVGANFRKNKLYSKKIVTDVKMLNDLRQRITVESEKAWDTGEPEVQREQEQLDWRSGAGQQVKGHDLPRLYLFARQNIGSSRPGGANQNDGCPGQQS